MTEVYINLYVKEQIKINVLLLLLILEQVNKRHSNIFTKRTEYESQGKQIDN